MNILIVSSYLPFPLVNGGNVRLYNLIKELSAHHNITLLCEKRDHQDLQDVNELKKYCEEVITIPRKKQWTPQNILKSGFSFSPFLLVGHTLPAMKQKIVETLNAKRFDVIHVETFYVYQNIPKTYLPVILVEHNIEYDVYKKYATTANIFLRPFLFIDVMKIAFWEQRFWKQATRVAAVSPSDKRVIERVQPKVSLVSNGVATDIFKFKTNLHFDKKERTILFIGDYKWIQNLQAVERIVTKIWPLVLDRIEKEKLSITPKLWIVGKHMPESLKAYKSDTIMPDDNAPEETYKIYQKSDILLAPLSVGGGSSYKIIESLSSGVPVVTTPLGAKGVGGTHNEDLLVGTDDESLASSVIALLQNQSLYEKIRKNGRVLIESNFSWKAITKELEKIYGDLIQE